MASRARVLLLVAAAALAAAGATVGVTLATRSHPPHPQGLKPRKGAPPLLLDLGVRTDATARALRQASALYAKGRRADAARIFDRYADVNAQVGAALAGWPAGSIQRLEALARQHPHSALVRVNLGLADFWAGKGDAALASWRDAVRVEPDSQSAVDAGNFLYPRFFRGLPPFVPSFPAPPAIGGLSPGGQLAALAAAARGGGAHAKLLYGAALQTVGRPLSAEREFTAAARLAPDDPEALTADAVGRFDKAHPERAFSRLGPLTRRFPRAVTVRFHLGLMLLWMGEAKQAEKELRAAVADAPRSPLGRQAKAFLARLGGVGTS